MRLSTTDLDFGGHPDLVSDPRFLKEFSAAEYEHIAAGIILKSSATELAKVYGLRVLSVCFLFCCRLAFPLIIIIIIIIPGRYL